ncbi:hypothetical protein F503_07014 [Ophiostoma piceae UAMH 11346]|uniref:Uncharacterized protein n=1 Tax=Ophiostoma piceae (strain UAMH 11346) TaxID=1262450 RepID=S3CRK0_OPHP1|nr:hypothetical protein F503_07014 [Ophiostoma piceae UAMH 11346]
MDTSRAAGTPAPASSRLPTKKSSFHSLREAKENFNINQRPLATSPTAVSDTSSVSDTAGFNSAAVNGNGNGAASQYGFGFDSRRSSTSSQQSDFRGRTSAGRPGQTRLPRPSPGPPTTRSATAATTTPGVAGNRRPLSIKDAFKMAEEEEAAAVAAAAQGSPSPAPRPWRNRAGGGGVKSTPTPGTSAAATGRATPMSATESRMQKILSNSPLDIGGRRTARRIGEPPAKTTDEPTSQQSAHQAAHRRGLSEDSIQSLNSASTAARPERSSGVPDIRRIRYEEDQARLMVAMGERSGGLFSPKARVSPKIAVAGRELHRRASNSSLNEKSKVPVSTAASSPRPSLTTARSLLSSTASSRARAGSVLKRTSTAPALENVSPRPARTRPSLTGRTSVSGSAARPSLGAVSDTNSNSDELESVASPPPISPIRKSATAPVLLPAEGAEPPLISSPGKSFAWNTDEDFTSDSLMVSESPPFNTRPDPSVSHTPAGNPPSRSPDLRSRNTKLDEIRQLEIEASIQFPDDASNGERSTSNDEAVPAAKIVEDYDKSDESVQPMRRPSLPAERQNKAIDEIRARENEGLSKRAISAAKLDEIRQRNAEFRTTGLDTARKVSHEHLRAELARDEPPQELQQEEKDEVVARVRARSVFEEEEGEPMTNTPVTIFRTQSRERGRKLLDADDNSSTASSDKDTAKNKSISPALSRKSSSSTHSRTESQELLRKLARVTTSVAAVERKDRAPPSSRRLREWFSSDSLRGGEEDKPDSKTEKASGTLRLPRLRDPDTLRPTVGFAQLRRVSSTDSATTKRSSVAQSDGDPIDRIEAEMKLFAAHGDQSERGSIRAPSPDTEGDIDGNASGSNGAQAADDATPKAAKIVNPLLQATPRVTGAYVETPITARTEKMVPDEPATGGASKPAAVPLLVSLLRSATESTDKADKPKTEVTAEPAEPADTAEKTDGYKENGNGNGNGNGVAAHTRQRSISSQRSLSRSRSRSRSTSRPRAPLINSAKPASARDDLLAIQRDQRIDDSTLDDFDTILAKHNPDDDTDASGATDATAKANGGTSDSDRLRRMSQSINTYIMDVQTAKKGIERLEDRVSHPEKATAEIMATAISGSMEDFDKEITAALNRHEAERQSLLANIKKEEMDVSDVDSIPPAPVVTKRKTHQRQSSSVASVTKAATEAQDTADTKEAKEAKAIPVPTITVTAPAVNANVPVVSYLQIPLPKLYRSDARDSSSSKKRLTFFGILVLLFAVWFAIETTACALYCRPETCQSGQACRWSPDDPSFGHAVPVKVDQWLTGGKGRTLVAWAGEEVGDLLADAYDAATGTDIQQIDPTYFSFEEKRRHRRRLQKRGLVQPWTPSPETRSKIDAWRRAREAREQEAAAAAAVRQRATQVHEGEEYDIFGDDHYSDAMDDDDKARGWW